MYLRTKLKRIKRPTNFCLFQRRYTFYSLLISQILQTYEKPFWLEGIKLGRFLEERKNTCIRVHGIEVGGIKALLLVKNNECK